ncbi:MAG: SH3 domain-containing protein [Okeania sp. SIO2G4]|uniref:SH3 domain-containing protein n=1 Tax=unclassified Okeania TaxID=2634635 RepID=UPI0013BA9F83|nr:MULTISPECIES: SH3 domain-containing protein [unclassified Okeania]NEP75514.1 SH3 domain-containing protein [Okeania sp. SIO2G5]NEP96635.1 SH3 domain-containing protein [Okeania sp. SIO2F5]NEQ94361.1 SH3 domain-containing protein [Okeania sp. SIO2G4]
MNIKLQFSTIISLVFLFFLGVKIFSTNTSHAAYKSQISNQILTEQNDKFLLVAAGSCEVSMPSSSTNERLVLNVREVPNGNIVGTVDDGDTVELETTGGIEGLFWVKIIEPVPGYVWTEYLTNCN